MHRRTTAADHRSGPRSAPHSDPRFGPRARIAAVVGSAALALAAAAPAAGAQDSLGAASGADGSVNAASLGDLEWAQTSLEGAPKSLADLTGGGLASLGLGGLGSTVAGGDCVAIDPAFGSATTTLTMTVETKEGASGVADVGAGINTAGSSSTELEFHWKNLDTGASGVADVPTNTVGGGGFGQADVETGVGTVEWTVEGRQSAVPLSVGVALGAVGSTQDAIPGSSTPYTNCGGTAEIA